MMTNNPFSRIKAIIFDKDGTLFEETPELIYDYQRAAIEALVELANDDLTFEEAMQTAGPSYQQYGWSFEELRLRYNISFRTAHFKMHALMTPNHVKANPCLPASLTLAHRQGIKMGIATHCGRNFARTNLTHLGIGKELIPDHHIMTLDDLDLDKAKSAKMVLQLCRTMGVEPQETLFVENTPRNLVPAKQAGLRTALITWGRDLDEFDHLTSIDCAFHTPIDLMRCFHESRAKRPQKCLQVTG